MCPVDIFHHHMNVRLYVSALLEGRLLGRGGGEVMTGLTKSLITTWHCNRVTRRGIHRMVHSAQNKLAIVQNRRGRGSLSRSSFPFAQIAAAKPPPPCALSCYVFPLSLEKLFRDQMKDLSLLDKFDLDDYVKIIEVGLRSRKTAARRFLPLPRRSI